MKTKHYVLYVILALSGMAQAQEGGSDTREKESKLDPDASIDVLLSNETVEARYFRDLSLFGTEPQRLLLDGFLNTDNSFQFVAGLSGGVLKGMTPLGSALKFSIGSRLYMSRLADPSNNVFGLGFGGGWSFDFPELAIKLPPLTLRGNYYYAPTVLTSGNSQDIWDVDIVEVQLDMTKNLAGIFGIRQLSVANRNLDNNWNVGIRWKFD